MTTITIDDEIKEELLKIAAELQFKIKKKVDYNDAIKYLLSLYNGKKKDPEKLSLACSPIEGVDPKELIKGLYEERRKDDR